MCRRPSPRALSRRERERSKHQPTRNSTDGEALRAKAGPRIAGGGVGLAYRRRERLGSVAGGPPLAVRARVVGRARVAPGTTIAGVATGADRNTSHVLTRAAALEPSDPQGHRGQRAAGDDGQHQPHPHAGREDSPGPGQQPRHPRLTPLSPNQIQISAKKPGVTQVNLWDEKGQIYTVDVIVFGDARELTMLLQSEFPNSRSASGRWPAGC